MTHSKDTILLDDLLEIVEEAKADFPNPTYKEFEGAEHYWLAKFQQWRDKYFGRE